MSHEIENTDSVGIVGDTGWHGLGRIIREGFGAVEAGEELGILEQVHRRPLFWQAADGSFQSVDSHVANVQTVGDVTNVLGVVGADYSICQNRELAEFTDALAQTGKVQIETAGTLRNGKRIWFLARGEAFTIGSNDKVFPYVCVSNGHDGTQAIRVTPTTVRVVCSNTLHMVIPRVEGERPETAALTIRHTGKIADKLEQAKLALQHYQTTLSRNVEMYEAMQAKKMDRESALKLFAGAYATFWEAATDDDLNSSDDETRRVAQHQMRRMQDAAQAFLKRYDEENAQLGLGETQWAAFNALTGYIQHDKKTRGKDDAARVESRIDSNLFGLNARRTHEVLAATLAA